MNDTRVSDSVVSVSWSIAFELVIPCLNKISFYQLEERTTQKKTRICIICLMVTHAWALKKRKKKLRENKNENINLKKSFRELLLYLRA